MAKAEQEAQKRDQTGNKVGTSGNKRDKNWNKAATRTQEGKNPKVGPEWDKVGIRTGK